MPATNKRIIAVLVAMGVIIAWFFPLYGLLQNNVFFLATVEFAGHEGGGLIWLVPFAAAAYAGLIWMRQYQLAAVAAGVVLVAGLLLGVAVLSQGGWLGWGLGGVLTGAAFALSFALSGEQETFVAKTRFAKVANTMLWVAFIGLMVGGQVNVDAANDAIQKHNAAIQRDRTERSARQADAQREAKAMTDAAAKAAEQARAASEEAMAQVGAATEAPGVR